MYSHEIRRTHVGSDHTRKRPRTESGRFPIFRHWGTEEDPREKEHPGKKRKQTRGVSWACCQRQRMSHGEGSDGVSRAESARKTGVRMMTGLGNVLTGYRNRYG